MKIIPPITITPAMLIYSNVEEPTPETGWVSGTLYTTGDLVQRTTTNNVYRCIKDIVTQTSTILPEVSVNLEDPNWITLGPPVWVSGTTYTSGQQVVLNTTNRLYQCLVSTGTLSTTSPDNLLVGSPIYWMDVGPSNKFAMFDLLRNSTTKSTNSGV
jgi:hypothetical protein